MRFQLKMTLTYAVFILLVGIVLAMVYHEYSTRQYQKTEEKNLADISQQLVNQLNELVKPMETRTEYILSDADILESIHIFSLPDANSTDNTYLDNAKRIIKTGLAIDYVMNDFFRVIFFNQTGALITSTTALLLPVIGTLHLEQMPWLAQAEKAKGKPVLVTVHSDPWGLRENPMVFSLLRAIQGKNMGYLEVQRTVEDLEASLQLPKENLEVLIFLNDTEFLYTNTPSLTAATRESILAKIGSQTEVVRMDVKGESKLVVQRKSDAYNITVLVMEDLSVVKQGSAYIAPFTVGITLIFCILSLVFVVLASHLLTKPIRQLRMVMEQTNLANLRQGVPLSAHNNELEALSVSYQNVLERLQQSMVTEKQMSTLHLRAQFDLLQAQVNPHFLYNVLNVITARGLKNGDEEICNLCASLAAILRYSTDTKHRYATVEDELKHLCEYFNLLKSRYEHKISFILQVAPEIYGQIIPKIALQQIAENCINHGFENSTHHMEVSILGWQEAGRWYLKVKDNGQGFDEDKLVEIRTQLIKTKQKILCERANVELGIGGMGLINAYSRLFLLYTDELSFTLENTHTGAEVVFGATLKKNGICDV